MDRLLACFAIATCVACGSGAEPPPAGPDFGFPGTAAIRISPARAGEWLLLLETLQPQALVTSPIRAAAVLDTVTGLRRTVAAPEGFLLLDAVAHPSGDVSLLSVRSSPSQAQAYPLRVVLSRVRPDGARLEHELARLVPDANEPPPAFMASLDRARLVATGEDLYAVVRWANNAVQAYRIAADGAGLRQQWVSWVEPPAPLTFLGIIGGGFDNFHQGDTAFFVHAGVDGRGDLVTAVASTEDVLTAHDAFFGEALLSQADPASFEFGVAVVTSIDPSGARRPATLSGVPGKRKRLLSLRVRGDAVLLVGRVKTGDNPGSWDGWILSSDATTGQIRSELQIDVQDGDMFWDALPLDDGRVIAVGSSHYTQNPSGLSVSDARDALAVVLDADGALRQRILLPAGPAGRGNEAMSVSMDAEGRVAIAGVQNAPGTHAAVYSDGFLAFRNLGR